MNFYPSSYWLTIQGVDKHNTLYNYVVLSMIRTVFILMLVYIQYRSVHSIEFKEPLRYNNSFSLHRRW